MTKSKTTIEQATEMLPKDDTPSVVAYRVGRLEETQKDGFKEINSKLDDYMDTFMTKQAFEEVRRESEKVHTAIWEEIKAVKKENKEIREWRDKLVGQIAIGAIILSASLLAIFLGLSKYNVHF